MSHDDRDWQIATHQQRRMFRLAERDYGLYRATISRESGIPAPTLKSYCNDTIIPLHNLRKLTRVIPDELTSLLFLGTEKHIAAGQGEGDLEALVDAAGDLEDEYIRARSDKSPGGSAIVPQEREAIHDKGRKVVHLARAVA